MSHRIGILGGTFDPIHNGHLAIAKHALSQLDLEKIIFIPAGNPWQKSRFSESSIRLELVKEAIKDNDKYEVSDIEVNNSEPSYTYETLQKLHEKYEDTEFYLLVGSDAVANFDTWKQPNLVKTLARIYVASRKGDFVIDWRFDRLNMEPVSVSATEIRERVKNAENISDLVPQNVSSYILANGLYK